MFVDFTLQAGRLATYFLYFKKLRFSHKPKNPGAEALRKPPTIARLKLKSWTLVMLYCTIARTIWKVLNILTFYSFWFSTFIFLLSFLSKGVDISSKKVPILFFVFLERKYISKCRTHAFHLFKAIDTMPDRNLSLWKAIIVTILRAGKCSAPAGALWQCCQQAVLKKSPKFHGVPVGNEVWPIAFGSFINLHQSLH